MVTQDPREGTEDVLREPGKLLVVEFGEPLEVGEQHCAHDPPRWLRAHRFHVERRASTTAWSDDGGLESNSSPCRHIDRSSRVSVGRTAVPHGELASLCI